MHRLFCVRDDAPVPDRPAGPTTNLLIESGAEYCFSEIDDDNSRWTGLADCYMFPINSHSIDIEWAIRQAWNASGSRDSPTVADGVWSRDA